MHLKSISLKGFKSFPDRTTLQFAPGVSVIVGPNGSGKSNITDAVLWALGEQSPLAVRGQQMQDVIFSGGDGRGQTRYAEVEVVIDNSEGRAATEFTEISIKRRLGRDGEGEYRLNGARCRLVDVVEVLSDTNLGREMHSVISQGRVEQIVHSRPRERRLLVEEAAGLGKHRKRRRRAQLKLERVRENLDRALDVEREARSRLRPLKRQAQAAEVHSRLERQELGLREQLAADGLREHSGHLARAERTASAVTKKRDSLDAKLADVHRRRTEAEERFAQRDRERRLKWAALTHMRGAHERLSVRVEAISAREAELSGLIEARERRLQSNRSPADGGTLEAEIDRLGAELDAAVQALAGARGAAGAEDRATQLGAVRDGLERALDAARRAELLAGRDPQRELEERIAAARMLLDGVKRAAAAIAVVREAVGLRIAAVQDEAGLEADDEGDITAELKTFSREEYSLQSDLRATADEVTAAEVELAQIRDRRDEARAELMRVAEALGNEAVAAQEPLGEDGRAEAERGLERLARRREQLGPVNPLAEREYEEASERVGDLERQRQDLESAMAELESLIQETDRRIRTSFEETFEATAQNFSELVEHLFPGGRGKLRRVDLPSPRAVIGGADPEPADAGDEAVVPGWASGGDEAADIEARSPREAEFGVEIEVTPAGKATKRLSLLSGGEKSLVALAFVFAVFLARPCPFYILDEVEAALDDANIDRFLQLVRRYSDRAQFVVVTHQKRTMDAADILYGVSMGGDGVTKVVSRRLPRDEGALGEQTAAEAA